MSILSKAALAWALLPGLSACSSRVPPIAPPVRFEASCDEGKQLRTTAVQSIIASTDDRTIGGPTYAALRASIPSAGGATAYWNGQLLRSPRLAASLRESDGYLRVRAAVIVNVPEGSTTRPIALLVRDGSAYRWITLDAYDVQNVCVEGRRSA